MSESDSRFKIGAVSYLNTVPLVWGILRGPQAAAVELSFSLPSVCAKEVEQGGIQIGLVPVAEIARQGLEIVPGVGIASHGAVRSILLFSRVPWNKVRSVAADSGSRTSVELARVILRERFGVQPNIGLQKPFLNQMLENADAALVIGDPALRLDPETLPYDCLDLGAEWRKLTGLPMVFAAWAGKPGLPLQQLQTLLESSYRFGIERISEIAGLESARRHISPELANQYLRHHIWFEIGPKEQEGLETFLELASLRQTVVARSAS
ncbi:MAG: menaquinone biosynthesis protein [Acidobacteriaceae bacterium]|nr:menaquinone biosynthesis protein [Acidobacteriaceae bacterium]